MQDQHIATLAKTADEGAWPKDFEYNEEDEENEKRDGNNFGMESHQTLNRIPSVMPIQD